MARTTVTARGNAGIDTRDFRKLIRALQTAQPELVKNVRLELREAGEVVAEKARELAEEYSESIPQTIKVRQTGANVSVVAGGRNAPIAGLFELGNTGGRKSARASRKGVFRHPVFGNREAWVNQPMHPYLAPALQESLPEVEERVTHALDTAVHTVAFGGVT